MQRQRHTRSWSIRLESEEPYLIPTSIITMATPGVDICQMVKYIDIAKAIKTSKSLNWCWYIFSFLILNINDIFPVIPKYQHTGTDFFFFFWHALDKSCLISFCITWINSLKISWLEQTLILCPAHCQLFQNLMDTRVRLSGVSYRTMKYGKVKS